MNRSRFGLIGHRVAHSLSAALFKTGYGEKNQSDIFDHIISMAAIFGLKLYQINR